MKQTILKSNVNALPSEYSSLHAGDGEPGVFRPFGKMNHLPAQVEVWEFAPGQTEGMHVHDHLIEYYHILDGRASMLVDGEELILEDGDITLVEPGRWHSLENTSSEARMRVMVIWSRIPPRAYTLWNVGNVDGVVQRILGGFRGEILKGNRDTARLIKSILPPSAFTKLRDGWPAGSLFRYGLPPTGEHELDKTRVIETLDIVLRNPVWEKGANDWASINQIFRRPDVIVGLLELFGELVENKCGLDRTALRCIFCSVQLYEGGGIIAPIGSSPTIGFLLNFGNEPERVIANTHSMEPIVPIICAANEAVAFLSTGQDAGKGSINLESPDGGKRVVLVTYGLAGAAEAQ